MDSSVHIENELPNALRVTGRQYAETRDFTMQEVALFIERDVFCYLRKLSLLEPRQSVMLLKQDGKFQVCIVIQINQANAAQPLQNRIENLVWAYNQQVFTPKRGVLQACPPRFEFQISVTSHENKELFDGGSYAQHSA